jgi:hypothetical protein
MKNKKIDILMRHYGTDKTVYQYVCSTNQARTLSDALNHYCSANDLHIRQVFASAPNMSGKIAYCEAGILKAVFAQ